MAHNTEISPLKFSTFVVISRAQLFSFAHKNRGSLCNKSYNSRAKINFLFLAFPKTLNSFNRSLKTILQYLTKYIYQARLPHLLNQQHCKLIPLTDLVFPALIFSGCVCCMCMVSLFIEEKFLLQCLHVNSVVKLRDG